MVKLRLDQLIREKQVEWQRDITYREIADSTNVSQSALVHLRKGRSKRVALDVLDSLCKFFACQSITEIIEYIPDDQSEGEGSANDDSSQVAE
jgi:DNA-binding Xre family transcriptional regulator